MAALQRRPKRKKGEQRQGVCVYCGTPGLITTDHVISKCLFDLTAHSTLRVDACALCQRGKGRGEENLRNMVNIDIEGESHPVAASRLDKMIRAERRMLEEFNTLGPIAKVLLTSQQTMPVVAEDGQFAGLAAGVDWPLEPALNTLRYSARGLYYHRFQRMLDPYAPVEAAYIPFRARKLVRGMFRRMCWEEPIFMPTLAAGAGELVVIPEQDDGTLAPIVVPDAVAAIVPFIADEDDEPAALWALVFNRAVTFLAGTENYASEVRNIHATLNSPGD